MGVKNFDQSQKLFVTPRRPIIYYTKMLASTLMRQHSRCLSGLSRQILSQKNVKLPKNSLVPTQCLTTSPALQHGSGDHTKMWSAERFVSLIQIPSYCSIHVDNSSNRRFILHIGRIALTLGSGSNRSRLHSTQFIWGQNIFLTLPKGLSGYCLELP